MYGILAFFEETVVVYNPFGVSFNFDARRV